MPVLTVYTPNNSSNSYIDVRIDSCQWQCGIGKKKRDHRLTDNPHQITRLLYLATDCCCLTTSDEHTLSQQNIHLFHVNSNIVKLLCFFRTFQFTFACNWNKNRIISHLLLLKQERPFAHIYAHQHWRKFPCSRMWLALALWVFVTTEWETEIYNYNIIRWREEEEERKNSSEKEWCRSLLWF